MVLCERGFARYDHEGEYRQRERSSVDALTLTEKGVMMGEKPPLKTPQR